MSLQTNYRQIRIVVTAVSDRPNSENGPIDGHQNLAIVSLGQVTTNRSIYEFRPMKGIVMGSGISDMLASILLRQQISNLDLRVYKMNADVIWESVSWPRMWYIDSYVDSSLYLSAVYRSTLGGFKLTTECGLEIPAHLYQATLNPTYRDPYSAQVAEKYGCMKYINFNHRVVKAE